MTLSERQAAGEDELLLLEEADAEIERLRALLREIVMAESAATDMREVPLRLLNAFDAANDALK